MLCPIHVGAAMADLLRPGERLTLHDVLQPMWLVPFARRRARVGHVATLTWADGGMEVDVARPEIDATGMADLSVGRLAWIRIELSTEHSPISGGAPAVARSGGTVVDPCAWEALEAHGARTYVAASLQSRIAGAGAGLSDND